MNLSSLRRGVCWAGAAAVLWGLPVQAQPVKLGAGMTTSVGVPLGVAVIVFTIILTWIYVRRANTEFDATNEAIIKEAQK